MEPKDSPLFRCWSKGLSFCLKGKKIAESITRRTLPPRAPLLLYGRNILRLGVPLLKNSSISYERALPPRAPLLRRYLMECTALPKVPGKT